MAGGVFGSPSHGFPSRPTGARNASRDPKPPPTPPLCHGNRFCSLNPSTSCSASFPQSIASASISTRASSSQSSARRAVARPPWLECSSVWTSPQMATSCCAARRINDVPANKRPTCMVFQSLALFPHRTVGQNIEFPLKIRGVDAATRKARALELMAQLRLPESYYSKGVLQCSGGERQRRGLWPVRWPSTPTSCFFRRAFVSLGLQAAQGFGEGTQGHPPRDRQDLSFTSPTRWKRRW